MEDTESTTRAHRVFDVLILAIFAIAPVVLGLPTAVKTASWSIALGLFALDLGTNYQFGLAKALPISAHLGFEIGLGVLAVFVAALMNAAGLDAARNLFGIGGLAIVVNATAGIRHTAHEHGEAHA